ncbi:MAG: GNAT family N-acetyltransferase [Gaiellaceae bacterium]
MLKTSSITIRAPEQDELKEFLTTVETAFGEALHDDDVERWGPHLDLSRQHWAFDGDVPVGAAGTYDNRIRIPGAELAAGGVTMVGVHPSHRRRGILTELMRRQLDEIHEHGDPLAILWASEAPIYGRFGYGVATQAARIDAERDRTVFRQPDEPAGRTRLLDADEATTVIPEIYDRVQAATPGMLARSESWWTSFRLADPERWRHGAGPLFRAVWELDGEPQAYALYRLKGSWDEGVPGGSLQVREALGTTPQATREIWRFVFGVDLVQRVQSWLLPSDHPLFLSVTEPRRLKLSLGDGLWVRLLDLEAALAAREYGCDGSVTLEVRDSFCPWNEGVWRLDVEDGERAVEHGGEPDLRLDVADLGSAYLGGFSFAALERAGRVEELAAGALARADALFRAAVTPWCPEVF